jgi:hypothetical protein
MHDLEPGHHITVHGSVEAIDAFWRECLRHQEQPLVTRCTMVTPELTMEAMQDVTGAWHLVTPHGIWST